MKMEEGVFSLLVPAGKMENTDSVKRLLLTPSFVRNP